MMWAGQCPWPQFGEPRVRWVFHSGLNKGPQAPATVGRAHLWTWLCRSWVASGRSFNPSEPQHLTHVMDIIISTWWRFQKMCNKSQMLTESALSTWWWVLQKETRITLIRFTVGNQHPAFNLGERGRQRRLVGSVKYRLSVITQLYFPSPELPHFSLINWTLGNKAPWGFNSSLISNTLQFYMTWPISSHFHLYHLI